MGGRFLRTKTVGGAKRVSPEFVAFKQKTRALFGNRKKGGARRVNPEFVCISKMGIVVFWKAKSDEGVGRVSPEFVVH